MKTSKNFLVSIGVMAAAYAAGCGDDERTAPTTSATSTSSSSSSTSTSSSGSGSGGGGTGGMTGSGGGGGAPPMGCPTGMKPLQEITGNIAAKMTLTADKDYLIKGLVHVQAGATLTIEPCTVIKGEKASLGTLVVNPGAQIIAEGTADMPIVFTSQAPVGARAAGDWGGVILLGNAPINVPGGKANVEGIPPSPETSYGGNNAADDSGSLKYVRIEFGGILLSPNNEVNGLTLAGVGSGTQLEYIQVKSTLDDCFEFFGGTVNAKHLLCTYNQDDGFDWDFGFGGKLQFLALQQDPNVADDTNGFEGDNDAMGTTNMPISEPTIYNATLCGKNVDVDKQQYGMLVRRSTKAHIFNVIATGFEAGIDVRDANTSVELKNSIFFGNVTQNVAYPEVAGGMALLADDDAGLDEVAWFNAAGNKTTDPQITDCFNAAGPNFLPKATITDNAAAPPDDGFFDSSAKYVGAFEAGADWTKGAWVSFDPN